MKKMRFPKPQKVWAYYNYDRLIGFASNRMEAIKSVEKDLGVRWDEAREYMQVIKVTVAPVTRPAKGGEKV